ncbi:MAG: hypothetical protein CMJ26_02675 [Phycisphaerae bacterium]|nr:hypothetical protein [Phycisphaerae bacterium]
MKLLIPFLLLMLLSSCTAATKDGTVVINRPFSAVDSDRNIVLSLGRTFEIVLPSNPTTGYSWSLDVHDSSVIKNVANTFISDVSGRVGVGGSTTWTLRAIGKGETVLMFSYQRPWEEKAPPTKVVSFTISVH